MSENDAQRIAERLLRRRRPNLLRRILNVAGGLPPLMTKEQCMRILRDVAPAREPVLTTRVG